MVHCRNNKDVDPVLEIQKLREAHNSELVQAIKLKINVDGGDDKWNAYQQGAGAIHDDERHCPSFRRDLIGSRRGRRPNRGLAISREHRTGGRSAAHALELGSFSVGNGRRAGCPAA
jgi:hypothetical protein